MEKIKSFFHTSKGVLSICFLSIILVLVAVGMLIVPSRQEKIAYSQVQVQNLYDDSKEWIKEGLSEEEIQETQRSINRLPINDKHSFQVELNQLKDQHQVSRFLDDIFVNNPFITEDILIEEDVVIEKVKETKKIIADIDSEYSQLAKEKLEWAELALDEIQQGHEKFKDYQAMEVITRNNLQEALKIVNESTEYLYPYLEQPKNQSDNFNFTEELERFSETILNGYNYGSYSDETLALIFSNPMLEKNLKGSPLNPTPLISLTFDDGPNLEFTPQVLDLLAQYNVKATFFVYGAYVDQYPEMANRIVDEGHIIANHSYTHPDFAELSNEEILQEITWTQESIYDVTGYENTIYRMPFGSGGLRVVELLPELTSIMWNLDSLDWMLQDSQLIYERVMANLSRDTLLLMHDTNQGTVDALAAILPELVEMGYEFVQPTELAYNNRYY